MSNVVKERIPLLMPLLLVCALLSGIFIPVYSDEIVTKFSVARFFLEDGKMLSFFPQCTTTVDQKVNWVFYPAAIVVSAVYAYLEPLGIRLSGIVLALIWFSLLAYWCHKHSKDKWKQLFSLMTAFASLGVMPYLWVISRPEQFMLVPLLILSITTLYMPKQINVNQQVFVAACFGMIASIFFYAHPKSLFFAPFIFTAAWLLFRSYNRIIYVTMFLYIALLSVQVLRDTSLLSSCKDAPGIQALLAINSLMPADFIKDPFFFLTQLLNNLLESPNRTLVHLTFNTTFQSGWLPPLKNQSITIIWLNTLINYTLLCLILVTHFGAIGLGAVYAIRRKITAPLLLAALLACGNIINAGLYNLQNFYAGIQYIPISITIAMLLIGWIANECSKLTKISSLVKLYIISLGLLSISTLFYTVTPNLVHNSQSETANIPDQPLSIPVFNIEKHLASIRELGNLCKIKGNPEHLVIDHMTYFAYLNSRSPVHVLYISELGYGSDLTNGRLLPFLKKNKTPAIITRCEWMPPEFRTHQNQSSRGYCCANIESDY
jgi:hypothetical protein